ncbi:uncharacterized protein LOC117124756 [Anneissia japonica]|uniref:uncharacterized protein LOC117124756 n=1 Tax=Anneissia japonica TaxID=1529436 RepID=UPI001425B54D|nr:uncharacterized protein LOC117124756 [Anneissia japonica]
MDATSLYITTCRYILNADLNDENSGDDLYRLLPYLRQSLSCCVCTQLLNGPMGPANPTCQHHVCQGCIGGKKRLRPACGWCTDYSKFIEKKQLRILLSCYKKMCEYIADTPISRSLVGTNGGTSNVLALLHEGMAINVDNLEDSDSASNFNIMSLLQTKSNCVATLSSGTRRGRKRKNKRLVCNTQKNTPEEPTKTTEAESRPSPKTEQQTACEDTKLPSTSHDACNIELETSQTSPEKRNSSGVKKQKYKRHSAPSGSHKFMNTGINRGRHRKFKRYRTKSDSAITDKTMRSAAINYVKTNTNVQKKLIISGRRAKLLREGRKLVIQQGCRCGTWAPGGGTASTCQGRRCPCFMSGTPCTNCKCKGCSNPMEVDTTDEARGNVEIDNKNESSLQSGSRSKLQ